MPAGAVRELLGAITEGAETPLVLDVGAGSGLLSLLAAQAGAQMVVGKWHKVQAGL